MVSLIMQAVLPMSHRKAALKRCNHALDQFASVDASGWEQSFVHKGPNVDVFYASGRQHVNYMAVKLKTSNRQDLISRHLLQRWLNPQEHDVVEVHCSIKPASMDHFILALVQQDLAVSLKQERYDLKTFTRACNRGQLPATLIALGDGAMQAGVLDRLLTEPVLHGLTSFEGALEYVILTDQPDEEPKLDDFPADTNLTVDSVYPERRLIVRARITSAQAVETITRTAIELALFLVDFVSGMQVASDVRMKSIKQRQVEVDRLQKEKLKKLQEDAQRLKVEREKEMRDKLDQLPREQRRKLEERELKKKQKRRSQVKLMKI